VHVRVFEKTGLHYFIVVVNLYIMGRPWPWPWDCGFGLDSVWPWSVGLGLVNITG